MWSHSDPPFGTAPSVPTPKVTGMFFDPAVGAVASLLLQPFSHPSFSLIRASIREREALILGRGGACCGLSWEEKGLSSSCWFMSGACGWEGCLLLPGRVGR